MPAVQRRQAEHVRRLGEGHRGEAALGVAPHLLGSDLGVEQVRELQRDHAAGREPHPLLEHPVVPRPHRREREVGIVGELLQALTGEAGEERREAQRRVHTVDVHVGDARLDVPRAAPHLVEARRLEAVLAHRATDDGVEPDVGQLLPFVDPRLAAVVALDDARRAVGVLRGQAPLEGVTAVRRCGRRPR